jgi:hypothetical protein
MAFKPLYTEIFEKNDFGNKKTILVNASRFY